MPRRTKRPRQIKFYVTEEQFEEFQALRARRDAPVQELTDEALGLLFVRNQLGRPEKYFPPGTELYDTASAGLYDTKGSPLYETDPHPEARWKEKGFGHWMLLWEDFLTEMPASTVAAFQQLMQDTLKYFRRTALRAAPQRGRRGKPDGQKKT